MQRCKFIVNSGEFSLGETNEEYCSLCGDGGDIVLCDFCDKSFCQSCIARISGKDHLDHLLVDEAAQFTCYICDGEPLREAKKIFRKFSEHLKRSKVPSIRACFKRKLKSAKANSKDSVVKDELTASKVEESNDKQNDDSDSKKNQKKGKQSLRSKADLTPAIVENDDTSSDDCQNGRKSPEVHTDDVMSDTNLGDELAKREKRKKQLKTRNKDQKEEENGHSSEEDEDKNKKEDAGESNKQKKKIKKRRKNLLVRGSSNISNSGSSSSSSSSNSDSNSKSSETTNSSSSLSGDESEEKKRKNSSSVPSDEEVKKKDAKAKRKSRIASYTSRSGSDSDEALQIEVSDHSNSVKEEGILDPADDSSLKSVEYRIAGDSDDSLDSLLTSDIELVQHSKKRRNPLKTVTSSDEESNLEEEEKKPRKRRTRKRKMESSSNDSDSDNFVDELKGRSRRRRNRLKKLLTSDSDDDDEDEGSNKDEDDEGDEMNGSQEDPKGKKRRKIRKLIGETKLASETKQALQEERERAERLKKRKQLVEDGEDRLILEQHPNTKEVKLEVRRSLVHNLKPHQREGIKFLYDSCVESMDRLEAGRGTGAVLAHCMGLGKTLQVGHH